MLGRVARISEGLFYRWSVEYSSEEAQQIATAPPIPAYQMTALLKKTRFGVPFSVEELYHERWSSCGLSRLTLGQYTFEGTKTFCFLDFEDSVLPNDLPGEFLPDLQDITFLTCVPSQARPLPESACQLGQLYSPNHQLKTAVPSSFVVAATPEDEVFWIWNPHGPKPDEYLDGEDISPMAWLTRLASGRLEGFPIYCTAVRLMENLDNLCNCCRPNKQLNISKADHQTSTKGDAALYRCTNRRLDYFHALSPDSERKEEGTMTGCLQNSKVGLSEAFKDMYHLGFRRWKRHRPPPKFPHRVFSV